MADVLVGCVRVVPRRLLVDAPAPPSAAQQAPARQSSVGPFGYPEAPPTGQQRDALQQARAFLRSAARHMAGRPVEAQRLVRWYRQWLAKLRVEPQEHSAHDMLSLALDPWERPEGLVLQLQTDRASEAQPVCAGRA